MGGAQQARGKAGTRRGARGAAGARGTTRGAMGTGAHGHGRGLGVPVCRLGVLVESVGPVWVFGAPDSL